MLDVSLEVLERGRKAFEGDGSEGEGRNASLIVFFSSFPFFPFQICA